MTRTTVTGSEIRESAIKLVEATLRLDILDAHKRGVINGMLWAITESRGKYTTRFLSAAAFQPPPGTRLQHEHVIPRKELVDSIMKEPARAREFLQSAVACVVTRDEHRRLSEVTRNQPQLKGWERYKEAGVIVRDDDESEGSESSRQGKVGHFREINLTR